ncbi:MAG: hypothetical protein M1818_005454 [Claussenomyces sp. TS43310]|nr:MAG: hypothetical protein M1818_005454 [Claussenomyces sp. TS43310]
MSSEIAKLLQQLKEAEKRSDEAQKQADEERKRADQEQQRARRQEQRANEEQRNRREAEKRTRPTTLDEYLRGCHEHLSKPLRIQTDKSLSTQGSITSPRNRPCPTTLKPWHGFLGQQQALFESVCDHIPADIRCFNSMQYLRELGQNINDRPFASEKDIETYERLAVEGPTTSIISHLQSIADARDAFALGNGIIFENHPNTLADTNDEVQEGMRKLRLSEAIYKPSSTLKDADQVCVYKEISGRRVACMVSEYKPPHKLSIYNLRAGLLRADEGSLDLPTLINRATIPTDPEQKFIYHSEWLTVTALSQTYGYMIENGLEYSQLVTAEAKVFLQVRKNEPHTLYYHLAEPRTDADPDDKGDILLSRTAVSQTFTFCLMALGSEPHKQTWRAQAIDGAYRFTIDYDAVLRQIPIEDGVLTPPPSVYRARRHPFVRPSPIKLRPRRRRKSRDSCGSANIIINEDPRSPSGSSDESQDYATPIKSRPRTREAQSRQTQDTTTAPTSGSGVQDQEYCTQACLLSLVRNERLCGACPNAHLHRSMSADGYHALSQKTLEQSITQQLHQDLDHGCKPLGKQGARGALFRLTLDQYGYTFVAKGTVTAFERILKHEASIYRHLNELQGDLIPVYLGEISLFRPYFLDVQVKIVHLLLMSWVGEQAHRSSLGCNLAEDTKRAVERLRTYGVEHHDTRPANVLWSTANGVMLVDFERSEILNRSPILQQISPNKRRRLLTEPVVYKRHAETLSSLLASDAQCYWASIEREQGNLHLEWSKKTMEVL